MRGFLAKISGLSRAQLTRLIQRWMDTRRITKSRAYRTTDNALVEGKNGAVVRKQIGYGAIGAEHAEAVQKFYNAWLNPYLNFHRPCGLATILTNSRGKRRRIYRHKDYRTPTRSSLRSLTGRST